MRIVSVTARTVRWPIASQGAARGRTERAAVILEVRSERGAIGLGEAAPLPGMSLDALDDVERAIAAFARLAPFEVLARGELESIPPPSARPDVDRKLTSRAGQHVPAGTADRVGAFDPCSPFALPDRDVAQGVSVSPPAARFAIETALLDALARERGVSIAAMLDPIVEPAHSSPDLADAAASATASEDPHVGDGRARRAPPRSSKQRNAEPVGAALKARSPDSSAEHISASHSGDPEPRGRQQALERSASMDRVIPLAAVVDDAQAALRAWADGIRCLKIKLAAGDDPGRVFAIAAAVPQARLRIDANRSWPRAEVVNRLAVLAPLPIDYVEEPCVDAHLVLAESLPCKIALDESLLAMSSDEIHAALRSPQLAALVLKPTLLGGFSVVIPLAALARRSEVAAIVSHTLEGPIGTAACAELALALGGGPPAGLAAHAALAGWPIEVPQLAADHLHHAAAPGLGFVDLDLSGAVRA